MLQRLESLSRGIRFGVPAALAALFVVPGMGCASVVGNQSAETKFLIVPKSDSSFWGWSEITVEQDANSVERATLRAVTIEEMEPATTTDLTFLQNIVGESVTTTERTKVVEKAKMPEGERLVPLTIVYKDDLRSFFEDGHTIRIEWTGQINPAVTVPPEGVWIKVRVVVEIE